jgi:subtilase family serine protease
MTTHILAVAATIVGTLMLASSAPGTQFLDRHVPEALSHLHLQPIESLPATNSLDLVIGLPFRNRELLTNLLQQVYDPTSTNFHHYLTPQEFTENFGPMEQDYQALVEFAHTNGLLVTRMLPNLTLLSVRASVADIERVFHTRMRVYQHPIENRTFFAAESEPSLELNVRVLHVTGLDTYIVPHPNLIVHSTNSAAPVKPHTGSGYGGSYQGNDFRHAYASGVSVTGSGQVVGLLELDGYNSSDITAYEGVTGLPNVPLQNILLDGFSGTAGSASEEVCLDIEMAISMAPGLSKVIVYEAPTRTHYFGKPYWVDILNEMAYPSQGEPIPMQLSSSWFLGNNPSADQIYEEFALQGQSFFQCSCDYGAYYSGGVRAWADSPYLTIVGGTSLTTDLSGRWSLETTWNAGYVPESGYYLASGGGISQNYGIPIWQQGVSMSANQGSTTMRNVPDVSMVADNISIVYNGSWNTIRGTSASTPLWAGFMALINQQRWRMDRVLTDFLTSHSIRSGRVLVIPLRSMT